MGFPSWHFQNSIIIDDSELPYADDDEDVGTVDAAAHDARRMRQMR